MPSAFTVSPASMSCATELAINSTQNSARMADSSRDASRAPASGVPTSVSPGVEGRCTPSSYKRHHLLRKPLHLLELRAALQQQEPHTRVPILAHAVGDLLGRA